MSKKPSYHQSSQFRNWIFTQEDLDNLRKSENQEAVQRVKAVLEKELAANNKIDELKTIRFISDRDQLIYCKFYESKIKGYCGKSNLNFDLSIQATATAFFKRFYLKNSIMDYDPKIFVLTCLFLAAKVENCALPLDEFIKRIKINPPQPSQILESEFELSKGINFDYAVHHPFWPLHGYLLDMQTFFYQSSTSIPNLSQKISTTYSKALSIAKNSLLTDLMFTNWPSQIAMACLFLAAKETNFVEDVDSYFKSRLKDESEKIFSLSENEINLKLVEGSDGDVGDGGEKLLFKLREMVERLGNILKEAKNMVPEKNDAKVVDEKLQICKNPLSNPESHVSKLKVLEESKIQAEKRAKKIKLQEERNGKFIIM
ncbi:hypothetical protein HK099_002252 [Clydaea vesicula]|uniref:Cyclin-like domain-containing protein n=1 Tax=Clydaea vesicula TaxID=447962 RepID=A0AAD5XZD4_9FUNG|nr:hypothetical protein HK099_002252 [Clydaea vesicula]